MNNLQNPLEYPDLHHFCVTYPNTSVGIYSAANNGRKIYEYLKTIGAKYEIKPVCFFDNNIEKQGNLHCDLPVIDATRKEMEKVDFVLLPSHLDIKESQKIPDKMFNWDKIILVDLDKRMDNVALLLYNAGKTVGIIKNCIDEDVIISIIKKLNTVLEISPELCIKTFMVDIDDEEDIRKADFFVVANGYNYSHLYNKLIQREIDAKNIMIIKEADKLLKQVYMPDISVYGQPKSGTSTVYNTLQNFCNTIHTHGFVHEKLWNNNSIENLRVLLEFYQQMIEGPKSAISANLTNRNLYNFKLLDLLNKNSLNKNSLNKKYIITGVREIVSCLHSSVFNFIYHVQLSKTEKNMYLLDNQIKEFYNLDALKRQADKAIDEVISQNNLSYITLLNLLYTNIKMPYDDITKNFALEELYGGVDFFDLEFKTNLGIDVYKYGFDTQKGYQIIDNDNYRILIYRLEDLGRVWETAFKEFWGEERCKYIDISLKNENEVESKSFKNIYKEFKSSYKIPKDKLEKLYQTKQMQYFYTEEERQKFMNKYL